MEEYRQLIKGKHKEKWITSFANKLGRLANGVGTHIPTGTNTITFIPYSQVPTNKTVTYGRIVCSICPKKEEVCRTRLTCGGDWIKYTGEVSIPTADITTAKMLFNSIISTPNAQYLGLDIKDFYLNTDLETPEYMRLPITLIPQEIIEQYNLTPLVHNEYIYLKITKGIYGLPQAGRIAHDLLVKNLAPHGYYPCAHTPGLWRHTYLPTTFVLCVDDFGVKYLTQEDANHLIQSAKAKYRATVDWKGTKYCGITLEWHYDKKYVDISVPGYVKKGLTKLKHPTPTKQEYLPHRHVKIKYGPEGQMVPEKDISPKVPQQTIDYLQAAVGIFLWYGRIVNLTLLPALNAISAQQSAPTEEMVKAMDQFLNYMATYPDTLVCFCASNMILHIHSDATYMVLPKACSHAGGYFYLLSKPDKNTPNIPLNGAIHNECSTIHNVMGSAAEAEVGSLYINCQRGAEFRVALQEMGHPHPPTIVITDNSTAEGIVNNR
eukprot:3527710-Ditylum_brightwellii.AAC.1